jgi:hypothetical protein
MPVLPLVASAIGLPLANPVPASLHAFHYFICNAFFNASGQVVVFEFGVKPSAFTLVGKEISTIGGGCDYSGKFLKFLHN